MAGLRCSLEYRTDFLLQTLMGLVRQGVGFFLIVVILGRFHSIAGWTVGEVAFLYGMRLSALAFCGVATGSIWNLQRLVLSGEFDRFLVRPVRPLVQVLTLQIPISAVGDLLGGAALLIAAAQMVDVSWTVVSVLYLVLAILGGALILFSFRLLLVSFTFRTLSMNGLMSLVDSLFNEFGTYPLSLFSNGLRFMLTFAVPVAFVSYFPATVLLGRTGELQVPSALAYGAPLAGIATLAIALWVFEHELHHYRSSGH